ALAADIAQVYATEAADRIGNAARAVSAALTARGVDAAFTDAVQRIAAPAPFDAIAARRRIAQAVIDAGKYPL
ncbi:MAG TPA: hypothetical protein VIW45_11635, partial [Vicinamibacterales bacterium]